ncbi:MAG: hypothetical protein DM484_11920 [Candidatus Methylumidiphilus alinenensis]|uniref:Uncharacterized protein n=1 Tax=Candidatus Methylumidiphilus alinenensis TaxID=2202197 RepID=A0A2W4R7Z8_9GAMM|nr:MAG: hypothetical protein DM484_11920 [Candidatus Methylumidiphilus alinenensis]
MTCRIAKGKRKSHATAQRRNVKAQVMGDMAMGRLTVTGLTGFFRSPSLNLIKRAQLHTDGLHITALRNISY